MGMCMGEGRFPTFPVILIVVGTLWLLSDTGILPIKVPWFPIVMILIGIGWIVNERKKE